MKVSVIMPVFNTKESYLTAAVKSILDQTYRDFELIIVDDGSETGCLDCLDQFDDDRVRIIRNNENLGTSISSNRAIAISSGEYIARMDSDDIAFPERLDIQVKYMDEHPETVVCGTACRRLGDGYIYPYLRSDIPREVVNVRLLTGNICLANPTTMIRKSVFNAQGIRYDENIKYALDYALWVDCIKLGNIKVIPEVLLEYRTHDDQISVKNKNEQKQCASYIKKKQLTKLGVKLSNREQAEFNKLETFQEEISISELNEIIKKIETANINRCIYDPTYLHYECVRWWNTALRKRKHPILAYVGELSNIRSLEIFHPEAISYFIRYKELYDRNAGN